MLNEPLLIFAHRKEIVLFFPELGFFLVVRTLLVLQLALRDKTFTTNTVIACIFSKIDVPLIVDDLKNPLDHSLMIVVCRSDKMIVRDIQARP